MTGLVWLDDTSPLPDASMATPDGLVAAGGGLAVARLVEAYRKGIFPWFNEGDPVLWWSPDPRMVLHCPDLNVSRSLTKKLRQIARHERSTQARVRVTTDVAFASVIQACSAPLGKREGTWILPAIQTAYYQWHLQGGAHSVEVWLDGRLAGGLYGVSMGRFFFGESMFSAVSDASKIALVYLVRFLQAQGVQHIDCQQETAHLARMGAAPVSRAHFLGLLHDTLGQPAPVWAPGELLASGQLAPAA